MPCCHDVLVAGISADVHDRLFGVRVKLKRARALVDQLCVEWLKYSAEEYEHKMTPEGLVLTRVPETLPSTIAVLMGDSIHNARSALDHLIGALVIANGNKETDTTGFPLWKDEASYFRARPGSAVGISDAALRVLYSLRPYREGNPDLWMLHRLDVTDKHRLLLATAAVTGPTMPVVRLGTAGGALRLSVDRVDAESVKPCVGDVLAHPPADPDQPDIVALRAGVDIRLQIDEPVVFGEKFADVVLVRLVELAASVYRQLAATLVVQSDDGESPS